MRQLVAPLLFALALCQLSVRGFVLTRPGKGTHTYLHARAAFGPDVTSVEGRVVWANPRDACEPITNAAQVRSAIALAMRSAPGAARRCDFAVKVRALQAAGAKLVVVVNHDGVDGIDNANDLVTMTALDAAKDIVIPAIFVNFLVGAEIDRVNAAQGNRPVYPTAVVNRTGMSGMDKTDERAALMQMLPGMRQVVSPFRQYSKTFDGSQHAVGSPMLPVLPQKEALSVVLNRGVFDGQVKGLSVVTDLHGGLYEPGKICTSLHGPRCSSVKKYFASAVGYQIFAPPQTNLNDSPAIQKVALEHLKGLLGADLLRRVKQAGLLQKDGVHYRVPDSVLPRYDVSGAGTAVANGQYVARQIDGYVGPVIFKQETPVPSSRVLARHNERWELIDLGANLDQWDRPLSTLYAFRALEGGERPPVIGRWDIESGQAPGPSLQYIEPVVGGAMSEPYLTSSVQRAQDAFVEREAKVAQFSSPFIDPLLAAQGNVTLYSGPRCTGEQRTITAAFREPLCTQCYDLCGKVFEDARVPMHQEVTSPHSNVASLRVLSPVGSKFEVHTYANCHGTWNYGAKERDRTGVYTSTNGPTARAKHDGCVDFAPSDAARPVHFVLHAHRSEVHGVRASEIAPGEPQSKPSTVATSDPNGIRISSMSTDIPEGSIERTSGKQLLDTLAQSIDAVDSDGNGHVSDAELAAAISSSALWVEEDKQETLAAALDLLAVDADLATEMVADGATAAVMRRLAQESARWLNQPGGAAHPQTVEREDKRQLGTGADSSSKGNTP